MSKAWGDRAAGGAEQAADAAPLTPRALAEPTEPVPKRWVTQLGFGCMGLWMASLTPLQILLPKQVQHIAPHDKFLVIGLVHAFGAIAAIVATPLIGAMSDRTTDARSLLRMNGRRHRWTLGMALLAAISLALISVQTTVVGIIGLWFLFSIFNNGQYATLSASIPDHVPVRQRATVAGWVGMPQALGLVIGVELVARVFLGPVAGYTMLAVCLVLFVLPFVLTTADYPLSREHREPFSASQLVEAFRVDLRAYPDFGWAWVTRFLASLSISMGTLYLYYFLRDAVHYKHPTIGLTTLILIYTVCVVITATVGGRISDRVGKRKMIVTISGALMGIAALVLTFEETWPAAMVAALLFGTGFGAYLAVDQALITQVLPSAENRGKDLGLINIAIAGPAAVGGLLAALLVTVGGYPTLFASTAVAAAIGATLVWRIKSVP
ncbi:MAG TPA: MFS transporter [Streptosporangiaceae bacterium]|nr:MFS transporter [Streptosporangiaceae bacterium]